VNLSRFLAMFRTVDRKFSIGGLCVCARGLEVLKMTKTPLIYSASCFNWGLGAFFRGLSPPKPPVAKGLAMLF